MTDKIKDKLPGNKDRDDDNYGDNSGRSGGGLMDKIKDKLPGGNKDRDSYGDSSDSYGSSNRRDNDY